MTTTSVGDPLVGRCSTVATRSPNGSPAAAWPPSTARVDTRLTRTVAVKVMHVGLGDDAEFARKFDREARAAARLSHPNVVSVFDQGADLIDGHVSRPYIVMEYVEGHTLRDVINRRGPADPAAGAGDDRAGAGALWPPPTTPGWCTATSSRRTS